MKFAQILVPVAMAAMAVASTSAIAAVDADAAAALFKKNDCSKCHSVDKAKKGPALKKIAANHKGKADAQAAVIKAITTGWVHPTINQVDQIDEVADVNTVPNVKQEHAVTAGISNSFGFGGHNSVVVFAPFKE